MEIIKCTIHVRLLPTSTSLLQSFDASQPAMPGRIKLSYQASVEPQPATSKRKTSSPATRAPAAKRTKANGEAAAPRAPRHSRSSANSQTTSRETSPHPNNDSPSTTPPSSQPAVAVKTATKKKQVSKPREKSPSPT